jgi:hypothetical protein
MKLLFSTVSLFIVSCLCAVAVFGQIVTTDPAFPTEEQPVVITFNASGTALQNTTEDVYAHTGVIINEGDISSGNWTYVIAPWTSNIPKARLTSLGNNLWQLSISDIRQYYGVPSSVERIYQIALVFRTASRSAQTANIYVDLYTDPVNVRFTEPVVSALNPLIAEQGSEILIEAVGNSQFGTLSSITLFDGSDVVATVNDSDTLTYTYSVISTGRTDFRVVAVDEGFESEDSFYLMVNPDIPDSPLPAGLVDGINYHDGDDTRVTLSLYAPYKDFVYVIGDFNDWELDESHFMNRDFINPDSVRFWITIENLEPGREYGYQYFIDAEIRIGDPYTEKVLDPWHDNEIIQRGVYPGLIPYPTGKTVQPVSVFQTAREPYEWQVTDFEPPHPDKLVIYELLVRDFLADRSYSTLADTLDYLKTLGINAIELMPVNQFEGNLSWGYNPSFFFAPDKYYGPRDQLKRVVDEAHKRGMAVILDMVWNHSFGQSPLLRMYFDSQNNRPADNNPWYMDQIFPDNGGMQFGYKFDHGSPAFREFMKRANLHWIQEYKIDGFRFDLTKGFTTTIFPGSGNFGSSYDQERVNNLQRVADEIWEVNPEAYVILEHLADNSEETVLANYGMMLWGNLNHEYNEATMGYTSDLRWGLYKHRGWNEPNLITYMESHDEQRLMWKNLRFGNINEDTQYNTRELSTALNRMKTAAAIFFTQPGPKMIWQFGELGYDYGLGEDGRGRTDVMPVPWNDYLNNANRVKLYKVYSALINLRTEQPVFHSRETTIIDYERLRFRNKRLVLSHETMDAVVLANFDIIDQTFIPRFTRTGTWYDFFTGDALEVADTAAVITLGPGEFHIFTTEKLPTPEQGILVNIGREEGGLAGMPVEFRLMQNYPNPFNPVTTIRYELAATSTVAVDVYDVLGRRVANLVNRVQQQPGSYNIQFDGAQLSSGTYLIRLQTETFTQTRKMMLLK